jgi:hypothetical protein
MHQSSGGTVKWDDASTWVHPPPVGKCNHGVSLGCNHILCHCKICDKVYCTLCGEEWVKELRWTYTWCMNGHNYDAESESS